MILDYNKFIFQNVPAIFIRICTLIQNRQRAHSTVSLRKRIVRANSEEKGSELKKSSTMTSFRPKL